MHDDKKKFYPVQMMKEKCFATNILDAYMSGMMRRVSYYGDNDQERSVYKVVCDSKTYYLKVIKTEKDKKTLVAYAKNEHANALKCSEKSKLIVKPVEEPYEIEETSFEQHQIEILFEDCGKSLSELYEHKVKDGEMPNQHQFKRPNGKTILDVMKKVAEALIVLADTNMLHADISPENIALKDETVKIIDFGVSKAFENRNKYNTTTSIKAATRIYAPPEFCISEEARPSKFDVYCWGMVFYQLVTGKTADDLQDDLKKKNKESP